MANIDTKVRIRLAAVSSNQEGGDHFCLEITDERSGTQFMSIRLTMEQFAGLVTCKGDIANIPVEIKGVDKIGMKHEHKIIEIEFPDNGRWGDYFLEMLRERVPEFEVNGWKASGYDLSAFNGHRIKRDHKAGVDRYSVQFDRWIEWEET